MMDTLSFTIFIALLFASQAIAKHNDGGYRVMNQEAQAKVTKFRSLMEYAYPKLPVFNENMDLYRELIVSKPRPYTVVFFSYNGSKESHIVEYEQFKLAANHYYKHNAHRTRRQGGKMFRPVFFAALPYSVPEGNDDGARRRGLHGHKAVMISTGEENNLESGEEKLRYTRKYQWQIQYSDGIITASKIANYIGAKTGDIIPYQEPISTFIYSMLIIIMVLAVLAVIYQKMFWLLNDTRLWIFIFFAGYFISSSAYVWTVLHKAPWTGIKDDKTEYIHPSSVHQHKGEGFMMGGLICGIPIIAYTFIQISKKIDHWLVKRILAYPLALMAAYMFYYLEDVVASKRSYKLKWQPGNHYQKGTLRENQGHSL